MPEPSVPDQTPVVFTLAGGGDMMSEECKAIVEQAGYPADCFGSYDDVKAKIDAAKAKVDAHKKDPKHNLEPSAKEKFLANCQSGHLSQNAMFQQPGKRGNSCHNIPPGGVGYHTRLAPCMPMPGPSGAPGTPHTLVTAGENETTRNLMKGQARPTPPKYVPMDHQSVAEGAQHSVETAVRAGLGSAGAMTPEANLRKADELKALRRKKRAEHDAAPKKSEARKNLKDEIEKLKQQEGVHRKEAAAALQQQSAKELTAAKGATASEPASASDPKTQEELAEKAGECIETFRKNAMDAMRIKVKQDYSPPNLDKTAAALHENREAALKRYETALQNAREKKPDEKTAQRELRKAAWAKNDAEKEVDNIACLATQANMIPETRPLPPMHGRVPVLPPRQPKKDSASKAANQGE